VVSDIWPSGPAARAGLRGGDVIVAVDGAPVDDEGALNYRIATRRPGDTAMLAVKRGGSDIQLKVTVAAPATVPAEDKRVITGANPLAGATVVNLSPAVAQAQGVDPFLQGVMVTALGPGFAQSVGLRPGDIIRQVNGDVVTSTADLAARLATPSRGWTLAIQRGEQVITARFG